MSRSFWNVAALVVGVLALAVGGPWFMSHLRSLPDASTLAARANERIVTIEVTGMTCDGCARAIEEDLLALDGVSAASVRHAQERAYVVCERGLADSALTGAIERAGSGFSARVVQK